MDTPKLRKSFSDVPLVSPIVSSINIFDYNLAKYLNYCNQKFDHCTVHKVGLLSSKTGRLL